jgi:hypothetical protein
LEVREKVLIFRYRNLKIKVMTYQDKIKAGSEMYNYLTSMGKGIPEGAREVVDILYAGNSYTVNYYNFESCPLMSVDLKDRYAMRSMNVEKLTKQYIHLYAFDMMGTRTTYKMPLSQIFFDKQ